MGNTANLEGAWKLDEVSGTRNALVVFANQTNNLTDNNTVTSQAAQFGLAGEFVRVNSENLSISSAASIGLRITTQNLTLGAWVDIGVNAGAIAHGIVGNYKNASPFTGYGLLINPVPGSKMVLWMNADVVVTSVADVSTAGFQHVAAVYNSANGLATLYINGVADNSASYTAAISNSGVSFRIGGASLADDAITNPFEGLIDEAFVFSRVLTAAELARISSDGLTNFIYSTTTNEVMTFSETFSRGFTIPAVSDVMTLTETQTYSPSFGRTFDELISLTETISRDITLSPVNDIFTLSETLDGRAFTLASISDLLSPTDTSSQIFTALSVVADSGFLTFRMMMGIGA